MKILVTGAAGLLGSHVAELALERGDAVRVLVLPGEDVSWLAEAGVEVCRGDLTDRSSLETAVAGVDRVLHCAARMGPWGSGVEHVQVNVYGTQFLVEAALAAGVQRFVHVSSIDVHGLVVGKDGIDETAPYGTERDHYCRSKIAGERVCQELIKDKGAPISIVRPGLIYGPRDTNSFARFARMIEQGKMVIFGPGHNSLPMIYVRDVARGVLQAGDSEQALGRAYLLTSDEPITQSDYFNAIARELGVPPPRLHVPYKLALALGSASEMVGHLMRRKQPPPFMRFGMTQIGGENRFLIDRARRDLGFSPQISLAEGVRHSVAWYRTIRHP
ncbi:MAG TPA: NAD-dependent epimerase/dehydratase family protein [Ktedonobacteraceae bacterium]